VGKHQHLYRRRRRLAVLACAALLLAACQPSDGDGGTRATADGAAGARKTTITALVWAPDWSDEMAQVAAEFTRLHPDIRVNVQFMIGNSVEENIKPKLASHKLPDLMSVNPNAFAADLADQGVLAEIGHTQAWANLLGGLKSDWTSRHDKHFGIAGGVAATVMYYNKAMFEKAGVKKLPANFDEFLAVCEQLKKAGFTPIMWNGGFPNTLANGPFSAGFANNVIARTPDWKTRLADGKLKLDTPEVADIFAKIALVADRGFVQKGYMSTNYDEGLRLFTDGQVAMSFHGTWASGLMMHGRGFATGVFAPPWNAPGKALVPVLGSETGFAVCETRNKEAATAFLEFLMGKGFPIVQNKRQNISPLLVAPGTMVSDPQLVAYVAAASAAAVTGSPYYSLLPANTIEMLHPLIQDVLFHKVTPQQAARLLDASVRDDLRRAPN
jgi:multiple sugar transport system substrate-binding protein